MNEYLRRMAGRFRSAREGILASRNSQGLLARTRIDHVILDALGIPRTRGKEVLFLKSRLSILIMHEDERFPLFYRKLRAMFRSGDAGAGIDSRIHAEADSLRKS